MTFLVKIEDCSSKDLNIILSIEVSHLVHRATSFLETLHACLNLVFVIITLRTNNSLTNHLISTQTSQPLEPRGELVDPPPFQQLRHRCSRNPSQCFHSQDKVRARNCGVEMTKSHFLQTVWHLHKSGTGSNQCFLSWLPKAVW